jgi:uncharacterized protein (TIGR02391 family)
VGRRVRVGGKWVVVPPRPGRDASVRAFLRWMASETNLKPKTIEGYGREVVRLEESAGKSAAVVTEDDLVAYTYACRNDQPATWAQRVAALHQYLKFRALRTGGPDLSSVVRRKPFKRMPGRPPPADLPARVRALADNDTRHVAEFLMATGLSYKDAHSIRARPPVPNTVRLPGNRRVTLSPAAQRALNELEGHLPIGVRAFQRKLKAESAGFEARDLKKAAQLGTTGLSDLHPRLVHAVGQRIASQEWELAVFAAHRAVEIRVRELAGAPADRVGVRLLNEALGERGPLTDPTMVRAEQESMAALFRGALGLFKNPLSHRQVEFEDDPAFAREVIGLADLLLKLLDRAEARLLASSEP